MNPAGIRRNFMNIVHNYTDAQVKVREATSNDPWGPSSTLMSEIADLTYNMVAFSEIMMMIWKRLNDHGKNWRHVYKALVLLEYMIKTGSEKVAQQCKENIFAIQTLQNFQYFEENKDQGINVREKAKQLVILLKDDERLKNERTKALKAKERFAQAATGIGSDGHIPSMDGNNYRYEDPYNDGVCTRERRISSELECARPQTAGEEELQLQLALAMSKEEADQEEQKRRSDDVRLQMAITQSEEDFSSVSSPGFFIQGAENKKIQDRTLSLDASQKQSNLVDLLDMAVPGTSNVATSKSDPWGMPINEPLSTNRPQNKSLNDLLGLDLNVAPPVSKFLDDSFVLPSKTGDLWSSGAEAPVRATTSPVPDDPWHGRPASSLGVPSSNAFGKLQSDPWSATQTSATDPWGMSTNSSFGSSPSLATNGDVHNFDPLRANQTTNTFSKKTPENFLGENSALVNLESLIGSKQMGQAPGSTNPFAATPALSVPVPPAQPQRISLNQMRNQQQQINVMGMAYDQPMPAAFSSHQFAMQTPVVPSNGTGQPVVNNPFL